MFILALSTYDRKQLEVLIKEAMKEAKTHTRLAQKMIPSQGSTAEFAYGLVCGTIIGNFVQRFAMDNGRQPDKDETADLFSIMIRNMPSIRKSVLNELKPSE